MGHISSDPEAFIKISFYKRKIVRERREGEVKNTSTSAIAFLTFSAGSAYSHYHLCLSSLLGVRSNDLSSSSVEASESMLKFTQSHSSDLQSTAGPQLAFKSPCKISRNVFC